MMLRTGKRQGAEDLFVSNDVLDAHRDDRATSLDWIVEGRFAREDKVHSIDGILDQRRQDLLTSSDQVVEGRHAEIGVAREASHRDGLHITSRDQATGGFEYSLSSRFAVGFAKRTRYRLNL